MRSSDSAFVTLIQWTVLSLVDEGGYMCAHQICKQTLAEIVISTQAETLSRVEDNLHVKKEDSDAPR